MRALVIVPTYNESATLPRVTEKLLAAAAQADDDIALLIVDDNSPDGTGRIADELAAASDQVDVLHRPGKSGLGPAYRAGMRWGLDRNFDALCEMDADLSHDPADVPRMLRTLRGADLVIGSRYIPGGGVVDWPWHRLALSKGGNRYVRTMTGMPVEDATSGFRAFRREVLTTLDLATVKSDGYSFQLEMALRTWRLGFRVMEMPITFTERTEGASKISRAIVAEALWRVVQWGLEGPRHTAGVHPLSVAATQA